MGLGRGFALIGVAEGKGLRCLRKADRRCLSTGPV